MKNLITIKKLLIKRGKKDVLRVNELSIKRGEVLAVVGPNGAGKSTLLLSLARLLKPNVGQIFFNGTPAPNESDTDYRRRIALVMQDPLLFDSSVYENVAIGLKFRGAFKSEIQEKVPLWLARLGVADLAERRAKKLSGGEAQRVSLARALVLEPELLLLDESFSALDPPTRSNLLDDLKPLLNESSTTTVLVTHDLHEAKKLATRMVVILNGSLRQTGNAEEIFKAPVDDEVARFLGKLS